MKKNFVAVLGLIAPIFGFCCVFLSISSFPWFNWSKNAISDLGHSTMSGVSPLLNLGFLLTGVLLEIYAVSILMIHKKWSGYFLILTSVGLQLVAVFDEIYGVLHLIVSVFFFVALTIATAIYALERRSNLAVVAFIVIVSSWLFYWGRLYQTGIAVPEMISSSAASLWIMESAFTILRTPLSSEPS